MAVHINVRMLALHLHHLHLLILLKLRELLLRTVEWISIRLPSTGRAGNDRCFKI